MQIGAAEATDLPVETRHMDMDYSALRWSDKPYTTYGTSGPRARDGIEHGRDRARRPRGDRGDDPVLMGIVNPNSPLIWDFRMTDALIAWAEANQPIVVTPFLLAGATAPVSVAGGLAQQVAEALSGVALAQLVRPGAPCLYGSFFTVTDMRTGSPAFGTPESVLGHPRRRAARAALRAAVPRRRRARLVERGRRAGGRRDAMMLWATFLAGTDVVLHAAGWLEGGLTASFEKFALDVELLDSSSCRRAGIGVHRGGARLRRAGRDGPRRPVPGSPHTREHFKEWLYMSPLFQTPDFATWEAMGSRDDGGRGEPAWKAAARELRGPGSRPRGRRGAPRLHGRAARDPPELFVED